MLQREFNTSTLIDQCSLAISSLFPDATDRHRFYARLDQFIVADEFIRRIIHINDGQLSFESESFLPGSPDAEKPSLIFVVGNPTPESVARRAMYAYESGGGRQHRFWKVMHTTGVLRFSDNEPDAHPPEAKMERLFTEQYRSPFNFYVIPFFSMPTPPSGPWSGVAGLRRLFGSQFPRLVQAELAALNALLSERVHHGDWVLVSQKDAYMAIKPESAPVYHQGSLQTSALTTYHDQLDVNLVCIPPTRLFYSTTVRSTLTSLVEQVTKVT